jgi:hypothetical protein
VRPLIQLLTDADTERLGASPAKAWREQAQHLESRAHLPQPASPCPARERISLKFVAHHV